MTWCAQYFGDVTAAYDAAHAADAADRHSYFATTYPLPNIEPAQRSSRSMALRHMTTIDGLIPSPRATAELS